MHLMIDYGSYIQYDMPAPIPLYYTKLLDRIFYFLKQLFNAL